MTMTNAVLDLMAFLGLSCIAAAADSDFTGSAMFDCSGLPCVEVSFGFGGHLKTLIDPTAVHKLGLSTQQGSKRLRTFAFTDGGVPSAMYLPSTASRIVLDKLMVVRGMFL